MVVHFWSIFPTNFHKNEPPAKTQRVREKLKIYFVFAKYPSCSGESKYGTYTFLNLSINSISMGYKSDLFCACFVWKISRIVFFNGENLGYPFGSETQKVGQTLGKHPILTLEKELVKNIFEIWNGSSSRGVDPPAPMVQRPWYPLWEHFFILGVFNYGYFGTSSFRRA